MPEAKWWLLSDADFQKIQRIIIDSIEEYPGCEYQAEILKDALHTLETGVHTTDAHPKDYTESKQQPETTLLPPH